MLNFVGQLSTICQHIASLTKTLLESFRQLIDTDTNVVESLLTKPAVYLFLEFFIIF